MEASSTFKEPGSILETESTSKIIIDPKSQLQIAKGPMSDGDSHEIDRYLDAVDSILPDYQNNVKDMAMKILHLEFKSILKISIDEAEASVSSTAFSSSVGTFSYELKVFDFIGHGGLSTNQVYHLRKIVERLNSAGSLGNCIEAYRVSRKSVIDEFFQRFFIGNWSISDIRNIDWEVIVEKMKLWTLVANICFRIIFPNEKQNYEQIFDGVEAATYDNCFLVIITDVAIRLCNVPEVISKISASLQKLFDILDLYNALFLLFPHVKDMFQSVSSVDVYLRVATIINGLESLVREIVSTFEVAVLNGQSNTPAPKGTVLSLTTYAMNYVIGIVSYKELLAGIIKSKPTSSLGISSDDMQFLEVEGRNPLALHLIWIIISLKSNLEGKSKHYEDASLGNLFMIDNLLYIVTEIKGCSELLEMIGYDYLTRLQGYIIQGIYLRSTWDKLLYCLRDEGLYLKIPFYRRISKNGLKKRFKIFNSTFEELRQTRFIWWLKDVELRSQFKELILQKLIPAYESLLMKYMIHMGKESYPQKYIKWSVEDLNKAVHDLLEH